MSQKIEAKEQELKRIFSDDYLFEIPDYQRPYAWTTEQTSELLDDLIIAMGTDGEMDEMAPYFLGSIVLIKEPNHAPAQVVDGQQRLTTLTILFSVLRDLSGGDKARLSIDEYICEKGNLFSESKDRFRLNLRERDRDFFREKVQTYGRLEDFLKQDTTDFSDSQKRIFENTTYLWKKLSEEERSVRDRLTAFLVQRSYLVVVSASDQNSAYRIFSVMNNRGLDLSPTDILKADIVGAMEENIRPDYTDQWEEIEEELGREGFKDLFAHIRMIYMKSKQRGTLNQEFHDNVLNRFNGKEFIDEVLMPLAESYKIVSRAAYESVRDAEAVNMYLRHLRRLDNYDWMPPAIAFFDRNRNDGEALAKFTGDLERLAYALFIVRANINDRINRYASILRAIENGMDLFADDAPLQLTPEEKTGVRAALDGPIYLQTRVRMPLLLRVDGLLADAGATYEHKVLSIEHVLPQSPEADSQWISWFPEKDEREKWTHRLGNLVLLSRQKNSQARNYEFDRKKEKYFQKEGVSSFAVTSQVLSETEWTPEVLQRRQKMLLDKLEREWRLQ